VLKAVSRAFERRLDEVSPFVGAGSPADGDAALPGSASAEVAATADPLEVGTGDTGALETRTSILSTVDLSASLDRDAYEDELKGLQKRLRRLQFDAYRQRLAAVVVYEGWDAAGKGGNIRRLTANLDPRGYEVIPIGAPNDVERAHHYLWRFWQRMPKAGHIAVFDRSWYGRVMVERVERLCSPEEWRRAYREINEMEDQLVRNGVVVVKFFLHLDPDEQLRRFREREETPHKRWKITPEDWRNREKWPEYEAAVDEMLVRTSTRVAPWTVIAAGSKLHARITALETVVAALQARL
jgi:polyphosphate kinase 2 (PPK2 family)